MPDKITLPVSNAVWEADHKKAILWLAKNSPGMAAAAFLSPWLDDLATFVGVGEAEGRLAMAITL